MAGYGGLRELSEGVAYSGPTFVEPPYRGQGLQRRLMRARINYAKRKGYKYIRTVTEPGNLASANNCIRCGYLLCEPWHPDWPNLLYFQVTLRK